MPATEVQLLVDGSYLDTELTTEQELLLELVQILPPAAYKYRLMPETLEASRTVRAAAERYLSAVGNEATVVQSPKPSFAVGS